ncbi:MAG: hypothetical protein JW787_08875 [Sedimentisphaerales bacterium]|nr:hypothetical protein [Sedimentisphaerales bacterium]
MSKKILLLTMALGTISFAGSFSFVWFTGKAKQKTLAEQQAAMENQDASQKDIKETAVGKTPNYEPTTKYLTEQQLNNLIHELRKKMQDYDKKLENLQVREQRLQLTQDILKQDIEKLNNLQIELASITANIKSEQDKLIKSRLEIEQEEANNLASIAATYDKMDSSSASVIISNMCTVPDSGSTGISSFDDAVKILHFMGDRTKAKLLADLASSKPELAADLSRRLKQISGVN